MRRESGFSRYELTPARRLERKRQSKHGLTNVGCY
jgi:hypothetical protein